MSRAISCHLPAQAGICPAPATKISVEIFVARLAFRAARNTSTGEFMYYLRDDMIPVTIENISPSLDLIYRQSLTMFEGDQCELENFRQDQDESHLDIFAKPNLLNWILHLILIVLVSATSLGSIRTILKP